MKPFTKIYLEFYISLEINLISAVYVSKSKESKTVKAKHVQNKIYRLSYILSKKLSFDAASLKLLKWHFFQKDIYFISVIKQLYISLNLFCKIPVYLIMFRSHAL